MVDFPHMEYTYTVACPVPGFRKMHARTHAPFQENSCRHSYWQRTRKHAARAILCSPNVSIVVLDDSTSASLRLNPPKSSTTIHTYVRSILEVRLKIFLIHFADDDVVEESQALWSKHFGGRKYQSTSVKPFGLDPFVFYGGCTTNHPTKAYPRLISLFFSYPLSALAIAH